MLFICICFHIHRISTIAKAFCPHFLGDQGQEKSTGSCRSCCMTGNDTAPAMCSINASKRPLRLSNARCFDPKLRALSQGIKGCCTVTISGRHNHPRRTRDALRDQRRSIQGLTKRTVRANQVGSTWHRRPASATIIFALDRLTL